MACRHSAVHSVYSPYFFPYHSLCSSSPHSTHVNIYIVVLGAVCPSLSFARCLCLCNTNVFGLLCVWCVCVYEPDSVIAPFVCMSGEWWIWTHTSTILLKTYIRIHNILSECVQHSNKKKKQRFTIHRYTLCCSVLARLCGQLVHQTTHSFVFADRNESLVVLYVSYSRISETRWKVPTAVGNIVTAKPHTHRIWPCLHNFFSWLFYFFTFFIYSSFLFYFTPLDFFC